MVVQWAGGYDDGALSSSSVSIALSAASRVSQGGSLVVLALRAATNLSNESPASRATVAAVSRILDAIHRYVGFGQAVDPVLTFEQV